MRTRLPHYKIIFIKNLSRKLGEKNLVGMCGREDEVDLPVPPHTIFIEKDLDHYFKRRVIAHELVHGLWVESGKEFKKDDQIELESLFHVPHSYLSQSEFALLRYLSHNFRYKIGKSEDLIKIRKRIDIFLGL